MKVQDSKIAGVGIVPLRCEICYANIGDEEGMMALIRNEKIHFVHTDCYKSKDAKFILGRMDGMSQKTKDDGELFGLMEENNEVPDKDPAEK